MWEKQKGKEPIQEVITVNQTWQSWLWRSSLACPSVQLPQLFLNLLMVFWAS
jgi:hypothetical protein